MSTFFGHFLVVVIFVALGTAAIAGEKEECIKKLETTQKAMMDVRYNYAEWYIKPLIWSGLTYKEKENIIYGLSHCRKVVTGYGRIVVKDGYSGKELGKMGVTGPKIYK